MSFFGLGSSGGERPHFRHFSSSMTGSLKKTQFYVWFLGSKQSQGLRGREYVLPTVRELIEEGGRHPPPCKVTVQISEKGMKIVQSIPSLSRRTGKLKMEMVKLVVPPHSITYSLIGPQPYTDVVSCILLLWNPETRCPVHIHVYRCDSPETASIMHSALQMLVDKPENQRALMDVEKRLMARGLLVMRGYQSDIERRRRAPDQEPIVNGKSRLPPSTDDGRSFYEVPVDYDVEDVRNSRMSLSNGYDHSNDRNGFCNGRVSRPVLGTSQMSPIMERDESTERVSRLHQAMFSELKEKLQSKGPILLPPKDYTLRFVKSGLPAHYLSAAWSANDRPSGSHSRLFNYTKANGKAKAAETDQRAYHVSTNELGQPSTSKYEPQNGPLRGSSPSSTLQSAELAAESADGRRKLRMFGDTVRMRFGQEKTAAGSNDLRLQNGHRPGMSDHRRLAASTSNIVAPSEAENGISYDENWLITRPHFSSVQNLRHDHFDGDECDRAMDSRTASGSNYSNENNAGSASASSSCSYPREAYRQKRLRRHPNPPMVCDPFGRKYERRTTVKNFWKNVQMPTKIEDNYGLWYLAPSDHCFP